MEEIKYILALKNRTSKRCFYDCLEDGDLYGEAKFMSCDKLGYAEEFNTLEEALEFKKIHDTQDLFEVLTDIEAQEEYNKIMSNSAGDVIDDFYANQKALAEQMEAATDEILEEESYEDDLPLIEQVKTVDIDFSEGGNWEEHITTLPLFVALSKHSLKEINISDEDVENLTNYTARISRNEDNSIKFELFEKETIVETTD